MATALVASFAVLPMAAQASVVTSNTGFTVVEDFEGFDNLVTQGPENLNNGIVVTSDVFSTIGASAADLIDNGTWGAGNNFAGIGDLAFIPTTSTGFVGSMTFSLGGSYNGVGALFSIYNDGNVPGEITIEALDSANAVLESTSFVVDLNNFSLENAGLFYGFTSTSANITGLRVSGDGFVLDNVSVNQVPLPGAFVFMFSGIAGWLLRRRAA